MLPRRELHKRAERFPGVAFDLRAKPREPAIGDRILQPRVPTIRAIAVVALDLDDRADEREQVRRVAEAERFAEARKRLRLAMGRAESAADVEIVPEQHVHVAEHRYDSEIVREDIDRVVAGDRNRNLKLAR